jgi:hypothetical protein
MLKVIDGLRTSNHANSVVDIAAQSVVHGTTNANVVSTSVDMANFAELLVVGLCNAVTGTPTGTIAIQESNEAAANFVNVTNAVLTFTAANTVKVHSLDWRKPNRKRYARLSAYNATNAITLAGITERVHQTHGAHALGDNCGQADS